MYQEFMVYSGCNSDSLLIIKIIIIMMMMITLFPPKFEDYHTYIDNKHQNKLSKEQDMVHMYKKANNELKFVTT